MLVHELMSRSVVTFDPGTSITAAARTLLEADVTAAPVVDDAGHLVGIVSRRDLIVGREIDDPRAHLIPPRIPAHIPAHTAAPGDDPQPPHLVHDVMSTEVIAVAPGDDDAHAAQLLLGNGLASLPVLDDGEIVGMVSVTDILRSHTHADAEITQVLRERFFEYGESHALGVVDVADGVVTITDTENPLAARIAEAVAATTEGVVRVHVEPAHPRPALPTTPHDSNPTPTPNPTPNPRNRT